MRLHIVALSVYFFACSMVVGQTISISDDSPPGSPISITGTMTFRDSLKIDCSITGHNHSSKSIITSAVEVKLTRPSGEPGQLLFQRDHFFKPLTISLPKSDFLITPECEMGTELDVPRRPTNPEAHAKVVFLQFDDGSTWGNPKIGQNLMEQRAEVLAYLQSLKSAYTNGGPAGLEQALEKNQKPGTMIWSKLTGLRLLLATSGISAVAETVDQNLATAEVRKALLK